MSLQDVKQDLNKCIELTSEYYGTEAQADELLDAMVVYERSLANISLEQRSTLKTINDLFALAEQNVIQTISNVQSSANSKINILFKRSDEVLLPPGNGTIGVGDGTGSIDQPKEKDRLSALVKNLQAIGVYADDIIITVGAVDEAQMRLKPYNLIEIPRLNADILVCDQIGEATFVSLSMRGFDYYTQATKEDLSTVEDIERIIDNNEDQWWSGIACVLQTREVRKKVEVTVYDDIREEIRRRYTVEEWVSMSTVERGSVKIGQEGIKTWSKKLGYQQSNRTQKVTIHQLKLGILIFGEVPILKEHVDAESADSLKKILQDRYTVENWVAMTKEDSLLIKIGRHSLGGIARVLGYKKNPYTCRLHIMELGALIYDAHPLLQETIDGNDPEKLKVILTRKYTPEQWLGMTVKQRSKITAASKTLTEIAEILMGPKDTESKIRDDDVSFLKLGLIIFENNAPIQVALNFNDPEVIKAELCKRFTVDSWIAMKKEERDKIVVGINGINKIGKLLGLKQDIDARSHLGQMMLGLLIFGENSTLQEMVDAEDPIKLRQLICQKYSATHWAAMTIEQRQSIKIGNKGIKAFATTLGYSNNPSNNSFRQIELGLLIFGNERILLDALNFYKS